MKKIWLFATNLELFATILVVIGFATPAAAAYDTASQTCCSGGPSLVFQDAKTGGWLRPFLEKFPKGADLHNHLTGAIYAETFLDWAVEDGLCVDPSVPALRDPEDKSCADLGFMTAKEARDTENIRRILINGLSLRSYVPVNGFSGHDQFFITFSRFARKPERLGFMLAAAADRAGKQNILYLELMETPILADLFPLVPDLDFTGDIATDIELLMHSKFGKHYDGLVEKAKTTIDTALATKDRVLKCGTADASPGCDVEIMLLYQVIREFKREMVLAQYLIGWQVISDHDRVVGSNLVAPEDGYLALTYYDYHMAIIDHLYRTKAPHNVSLHAGELTMGLVRPKQLRNHIRKAIDIGHAKRIGHGIDIPFEEGSLDLITQMRENEIMVEINLTSNDVILGVSGADHPVRLYRRFFVPTALSTDDEGVSRIDLTHEYQRAVQEQDYDYADILDSSRNSLTYSFLTGASLWSFKECQQAKRALDGPSAACRKAASGSQKAMMQIKLEDKIAAFERSIKAPALPRRLY